MRWRHLLLGALAVILSACARIKPPAISGPEVSGTERAAILERVLERDRKVRSFKGLYRTVFERGPERALMRYLIQFEKPNRMRVEVLPINGAYAVSLLIDDGERIALIDTVQRRAFLGTEGSKFVRSALSIPVEPRSLMSYLLGAIPSDSITQGDRVYRLADGESYAIVAADLRTVWTIDSASGALRSAEMRKARVGASDFIHYQYTGEADESGIPAQIEVLVPGDNLIMRLTTKSQALNASVEPRSFLISIPDGYEVTSGLARPPGEF